MDLDTIGFFLYMEEQENKKVEFRSGELISTSSELDPQQDEDQNKK